MCTHVCTCVFSMQQFPRPKAPGGSQLNQQLIRMYNQCINLLARTV